MGMDEVDFLVQAFPNLGAAFIQKVLEDNRGVDLDVITSILEKATSYGHISGNEKGKRVQTDSTASTSTLADTSHEYTDSKPTKSFLSALKSPLRRGNLVPFSNNPHKHKKKHKHSRQWWQPCSETSVGRILCTRSERLRGQDVKQKVASNNPPGTSKDTDDEKLNLMLSMFEHEIESSIILDVLAFCKSNMAVAVDILVRMLRNPSDLQKCNVKQNHVVEKELIDQLKQRFPKVDDRVLENAIDAGGGNLKDAVEILNMEYQAEDTPVKRNRIKYPKTNAQSSSSWTEVVSKSKGRSDVTYLQEKFVGLDIEVLETVYQAMNKNLHESIEYLSKEMKFAMSSPKETKANIAQQHKKVVQKASKTVDGDDYTVCRQKANDYDKAMRQYFQGATNAYNAGNGKLAKDLANQGKDMMNQRNNWQHKAAETTCKEMNEENVSYYPFDLHGLHVEEAIQALRTLLKSLARVPGKKLLNVITGKGSRSSDGIGKIKKAVKAYLQERNILYTIPDENPGCIHIHLESTQAYLKYL